MPTKKFLSLTSIYYSIVPENNRVERIWKIAQFDFQSRYYNDRLGLLWALLRPLYTAGLYYVAFKYLLGVQREAFGIFLFAGIITWSFFAEATSRSMQLIKGKSYLIENIQFNHFDIYVSYLFSNLLAFSFNFCAYVILALILGEFSFSSNLLYLPVALISLFLLTLMASVVLSVLQPFVKDLSHLWDMMILTGFWLSGIFYDPTDVFIKYPYVSYLNPFLGIIYNIRGATLSSCEVNAKLLVVNFFTSLLLVLLMKYVYFNYFSKSIEKI